MSNIPIEEFPTEGLDFDIKSIEKANLDRKAHGHEFYGILWFREGSGIHHIDFNKYTILPDRFHFFAPGKVHFIEPELPIKGLALLFTEGFLADAEFDNPLWYQYPFFSFYNRAEFIPTRIEMKRSKMLFENIIQEHKSSFPDRIHSIKHLLRLLLIHINRNYSHPKAKVSDSRVHRYFRDFILMLNENFQRHRKVDYYAGYLGITPAHLTSCTNTVSGFSASRLIQDRTVLEIKRQLKHSRMPVHRIATDLNFEDGNYLSRYFKKATGKTPNEFRSG